MAFAHSLGVDRADLVARAGNEYALISKVPTNLAPLIKSPEISNNCTFIESSSGLRGEYSVTFRFTCLASLTAGEQIKLTWERDGVLLTATWIDGSQETRLVHKEGGYITLNMDEFLAGSGAQPKGILKLDMSIFWRDSITFFLC